MPDRTSQSVAKKLVVILLSLTGVFAASCSLMHKGNTESSGRVISGEDSKRSGTTSAFHYDVTDSTNVTLDPTGSFGSEVTEPVSDIGTVMDSYLDSFWYDAVEDNPLADYSVSSEKLFAVKAVFYFTQPLKGKFEVRLYKDSEVIITKDVSIEQNVTLEADFSAGIEGLGTFEIGTYYVELVYEGSVVANSPELTVV